MNSLSPARRICRFAMVAACFGLVDRAGAESFTTNLLDGVTTNAAGPFTVGDTGPFNVLLVINGGRLTNTTGTIGNHLDGRNNFATVTGVGSVWQNSGSFTVGATGALNQVAILAGARLGVGASTIIGRGQASSNNLVSVAGAGTVWTNAGAVTVGAGGAANRLVIADAAQFSVGGSPGFGDLIKIGEFGHGNELTVTNGGRVSAGGIWTGLSTWYTDDRISKGNQLVVRGPDSLVRAGAGIYLGGVSNAMELSDGASLEGHQDSIGSIDSLGNVARIEGRGTTWTNLSLVVGTHPFSWGGGLENRLTLRDGAWMKSGSVVVGDLDHAHGNRVEVSGVGTGWLIGSNLVVGRFARSNLFSMHSGAEVAASNVVVGAGSFAGTGYGFVNQLVVSNSGTRMNLSGQMVVGDHAAFNRLQVVDGAALRCRDALIGVSPEARTNSAFVAGVGSLWLCANQFVVGSSGTDSSLRISGGATVRAESFVVGVTGFVFNILTCVSTSSPCGSTTLTKGGNTVTVTDPGSLLEIGGDGALGRSSLVNTMVVSNGGAVVAGRFLLGEKPELIRLAQNPDRVLTFVNTNLNNQLTIDGGSLIVTNLAHDALFEPRFGKLSLRSGLVVADRLTRTNGGTSQIEHLGGILRLGGGTIRTGGPLVVGNGLHRAELRLAPAMPDRGTLQFDLSAGVVVRPNAALTGAGLAIGAITNRGSIFPGGRDVGALGLGELFSEPDSSLHFDLGGNQQGVNYDYLGLGSAFGVKLHGRLSVSLRGGFVPASRDEFQIIGAAGGFTGNFDNVPLGGRLKTADQLGSFRVSTNGDFVVLSDYQSTDLDGDAIDDAWSMGHFRHSPLTAAERQGDADGDGASNADEFRAGTDPTDANNVFKAVVARNGNTVTVEFDCVEGRSYHVWFSGDLESWHEVPDPTLAFPRPGRCQWLDEVGGTGARPATAPLFYRVSVD